MIFFIFINSSHLITWLVVASRTFNILPFNANTPYLRLSSLGKDAIPDKHNVLAESPSVKNNLH